MDIRKNVAWNARAEGEAAVVATRAKGSFGILRAIVHGFNRTSYGFPKGIGRRRAVVEADAKLSKMTVKNATPP